MNAPRLILRLVAASLVMALLDSGGVSNTSALPTTVTIGRTDLQGDWLLQSSAEVGEDGQLISSVSYQPEQWYPVSVPATVIAGLLQNNVYPDPFVGENLGLIAAQDFDVPWWYRLAFSLPEAEAGQQIWLSFQGINYRANVWLNGVQIADSTEVVGAFREYQFDVTDRVTPGGTNVLAVEVFRPQENDLAINFVDWSPTPPDHGMGLTNAVFLFTSGPVVIQHPMVATTFDLPSLDVAHLTVVAEVKNGSDRPVKGTLKGTIGEIVFSQEVALAAGETKSITFDPDNFPLLNIQQPRIWWPWQYGTPELYDLNLEFDIGRVVSDQSTSRFGIRQATTEMLDGNLIFLVNGKRILIRGAAWTPDMFLRRSPERQEAEFRYIRHLGLNAIRLEGKFEDEHFFDLADENGILILIGWCCCDQWQSPGSWNDEQRTVAMDSLTTQLYRLRAHPSLLVWMNGSDMPPSVGNKGDPSVEQAYLDIESRLQWPNPILSSAKDVASTISGPTGVKMRGPYEWEPPIYWTTDTNQDAGGAWGFATEISPGPAVPPLESLQQMLGLAPPWPMDDAWLYHTGGETFHNLNIFTNALNARYGEATSAADYAEKAQLMAYESHRAMFEAYGANKYTSTGVIQWMLNNAWPSMIWHLYDYYLRPGGSYFGTKMALQPLHIQYSYDDRSIRVVNSTLQVYPNLQATADLYAPDGTLLDHYSASISLPPDGVTQAFTLPERADLPIAYFLRLTLLDSSIQPISLNTYWLSTQPDVVDWNRGDWYHTPVSSYADYTSLQDLPPASLEVTSQVQVQDSEQVQHLTLSNRGKTIAFFVHLKLTKGKNGAELLPILWEDNYITIFPGETRSITAVYTSSNLEGQPPHLYVEGYNVPVFVVQLPYRQDLITYQFLMTLPPKAGKG